MRLFLPQLALLALFALATGNLPANAASPSPAEKQIRDLAAEQKYAFVVFYKQNDAATQAVSKTLADGLTNRSEQAAVVYVNITDAANKALVEKYKTARAPMPMTLAIAPNGAVTGAFAQKLDGKLIAESFVTPMTATCMKSLQDGKVVFLNVHAAGASAIPRGVQEFHADSEFKGRVTLVSMRIDDKAEASFLSDLEIDATKAQGTTVVFMAPPGVMVGIYGATVTKAKLAADLHAAGKCCDDPNCKHGKKAN